MNIKLLALTLVGVAASEEDKPRRLRASGANVKKSSPSGSRQRPLTQSEKLTLLEKIKNHNNNNNNKVALKDMEESYDYDDDFFSFSFDFSFDFSFSLPDWDDDDDFSMSMGNNHSGGTRLQGPMAEEESEYDDDIFEKMMSMSFSMSFPWYDDDYVSMSMNTEEGEKKTENGDLAMPALADEAKIY